MELRHLKASETTWALTRDIIHFFFLQTVILYACGKQNDSVKWNVILILQPANKFREYQCTISSVLAFQGTQNYVVPIKLHYQQAIVGSRWTTP